VVSLRKSLANRPAERYKSARKNSTLSSEHGASGGFLPPAHGERRRTHDQPDLPPFRKHSQHLDHADNEPLGSRTVPSQVVGIAEQKEARGVSWSFRRRGWQTIVRAAGLTSTSSRASERSPSVRRLHPRPLRARRRTFRLLDRRRRRSTRRRRCSASQARPPLRCRPRRPVPRPRPSLLRCRRWVPRPVRRSRTRRRLRCRRAPRHGRRRFRRARFRRSLRRLRLRRSPRRLRLRQECALRSRRHKRSRA
jgi:hypothetical protein